MSDARERALEAAAQELARQARICVAILQEGTSTYKPAYLQQRIKAMRDALATFDEADRTADRASLSSRGEGSDNE